VERMVRVERVVKVERWRGWRESEIGRYERPWRP
jgi:hypothetical protein